MYDKYTKEWILTKKSTCTKNSDIYTNFLVNLEKLNAVFIYFTSCLENLKMIPKFYIIMWNNISVAGTGGS